MMARHRGGAVEKRNRRQGMFELARIRDRKTGRLSSWDTSGRNNDAWTIPPGQTAVLADIRGPACITHIWMTQPAGYRECLLKITFDNAEFPSVLCPLGDFFCLGHFFLPGAQHGEFFSVAVVQRFDTFPIPI